MKVKFVTCDKIIVEGRKVFVPCLAMVPILRDHKVLVGVWLDSGNLMKSKKPESIGSNMLRRGKENILRILAIGRVRALSSRKYSKQAHHAACRGVKMADVFRHKPQKAWDKTNDFNVFLKCT